MDETLYDAKGVKVTGTHLSVYDRTYEIGEISSIHVSKEPRSVIGTVLSVCVFVVVIFFGGTIAAVSNNLDSQLRPLMMIGVPILSIVGVGVWFHYSPKYHVLANSAAGETEIYTTTSRKDATLIVDVVRKAMD